MSGRDYQKSKVYAWEREHLNLWGGQPIPRDQAQRLINYIWEQEGLKFPPQVQVLAKQNRRAGAKADRLSVELPEHARTGVIIHELAHSMTGDLDDTDGHGPDFMGVYIGLLVKYMNYNFFTLIFTAKAAKLKVNVGAVPYMKD